MKLFPKGSYEAFSERAIDGSQPLPVGESSARAEEQLKSASENDAQSEELDLLSLLNLEKSLTENITGRP